MTNLVVDSSVAVKWFVPEPHSTEASRMLAGYQAGTLSFLAPDLLNAEFGNIVWKKHLFQGLAAAAAQSILDNFRALQFTFTPMTFLLDDAFKLALRHRRTVYDSMFIALSVRAGCQFVTADEKLVNAVSSSCPNLVWLPNWS